MLSSYYYNVSWQVENFIQIVGKEGFYGFQEDTVNSLVLSLMPSVDFKASFIGDGRTNGSHDNPIVNMLIILLQNVRQQFGFNIPYVGHCKHCLVGLLCLDFKIGHNITLIKDRHTYADVIQ